MRISSLSQEDPLLGEQFSPIGDLSRLSDNPTARGVEPRDFQGRRDSGFAQAERDFCRGRSRDERLLRVERYAKACPASEAAASTVQKAFLSEVYLPDPNLWKVSRRDKVELARARSYAETAAWPEVSAAAISRSSEWGEETLLAEER